MKAIIIGATGAVGTHLVRELIAHSEITTITLLLRRKHIDPLIATSNKVTQHLVDLQNPSSYQTFLAGHDLGFSTLGIGEPSKHTKEEFFKIDYETVKHFASECKRSEVRHFSSLGAIAANRQSFVYYLKIKGQLEDDLRQLNFTRLSLFRPCMIITPQNRYGWSQALALKFYPYLDPYLTGSWEQYRSIKVEQLGKAIALNSLSPQSGSSEVLTWKEISNILSRSTKA